MGNLYGDLVSDLGAGLVGGISATHGINVGDGVRVYEAFHGGAARGDRRGPGQPAAAHLRGVRPSAGLGGAGGGRRIRGRGGAGARGRARAHAGPRGKRGHARDGRGHRGGGCAGRHERARGDRAYPDAGRAVVALGGESGARRAAVLPRDAVGDDARLALRDAGIECLTTLEGGGPADAAWLARELAESQGWRLAAGAPGPAGHAPGDVVGWYELRIAPHALTTDRPLTRLHGARHYIASFNLLGQGRLNQRCGELLYERLADEGIAPEAAFDTVVCSESKAVGMVQVLVDRSGSTAMWCCARGSQLHAAEPAPAPGRRSHEHHHRRRAIPRARPLDVALVDGRRVLLVDDVIATGGTVRAACRLLQRAGATVAATATVLLKGPEPEVPRLVVLARPLL